MIIHEACMKSYLWVCQFAIWWDPSCVNALDEFGNAPIQYAESAEVVKELVKHGSRVDYPGLVHSAVQEQNYELCKVLLESGADPNSKFERKTPLHTCLLRELDDESIQICNLLLEFGANPFIEDNHRHTPLHTACEFRAFELVKKMVEGNIQGNVNVRDANGSTPLATSIEFEKDPFDFRIAKYLVSKGAEPKHLRFLDMKLLYDMEFAKSLVIRGATTDRTFFPRPFILRIKRFHAIKSLLHFFPN